MRKVKIVADSSCDMFTLENIEFSAAPLKVITAEKEFIDDPTLNVDGMVDYLYQYKGKSSSSCPNTNEWLEAFGDADDIFCLTITSALSGSYNSACVAKQICEAENPGRRVHVFDTLSAGPEISLIIRMVEKYVQSGMSFEDVITSTEEYMQHTGLLFMLKSLRNFANNGRVSPMVAKLVGIAGVCIVGKASSEGTLEPIHKCRGERRSIDALLDELQKEGYRAGRISIGHCQNETAANQLSELIRERVPDAEIEIHKFGGLCSFYAEKGGVLVGFEKG